MVDAAHYLAKATFTKNINNFVSVSQVVAKHNVVVATVIVIAEIMRRCIEIANELLCFRGAAKVNLFVIDDFSTLKDIQVGRLNCADR